METFRVLTLNLVAYQHADGATRHEVTRRELAMLSPDVVALQGVTRRNDFDQAVELLGPSSELVDHHKPNHQLDAEVVRERQTVAAARFVDEVVGDRDDLPVVLLGGLDATPDSAGGCGPVLDRPVGGVWASDHCGVYADLRRPPHPPGKVP